MVRYRKIKRFLRRNIWWFALSALLLLLLIYGLSGFTKEPTVETITTHAPTFNSNNNLMHDVDYQSPKKTRRR